MPLFKRILLHKCRLCHHNLGHICIKNDKQFIEEVDDCIKITLITPAFKNLPQTICGSCYKTIKAFYAFKRRVQEVDQHFTKLLNTRSEKNVSLQSLICTGCNRKFEVKDELITHQCAHKTTINNEEAILSDDETPLDSEVKTDFKNGKFVCTYVQCKKILESSLAWKIHLAKHEKTGPFLCVSCGKRFLRKRSLHSHEKIHLAVKAYACKLCKIEFSVPSNLRTHVRTHHEGFRFYCSQCPKNFLAKDSLDRHELTHTGVKEFQCEMCPSAFYTHKELVRHQKYHQGLRLYKCEQCFKTFFDRHHLTIHLRIHTGERPFVCKAPECGKSFVESQKLKRHTKAVHARN